MVLIRVVVTGDKIIDTGANNATYSEKSAFVGTYVQNRFCEASQQTEHRVDVKVDGKNVTLCIWESTGKELDFHAYPRADLFIVLYSVEDKSSLDAATKRFIPKLMEISPETPLVLVATQTEKRKDSKKRVTRQEGEMEAHLAGTGYLECSTKDNFGVKEAIETPLSMIYAYLTANIKLAAERGHPTAQYQLAMKILQTQRGKSDIDEFMKWLKLSATRRVFSAQLQLIEVYLLGLYQREKNFSEAVKFYNSAMKRNASTPLIFEGNNTILHHLCQFGDINHIQALERNYAKHMLLIQNDEYYTPRQYAEKRGNVQMINWIIALENEFYIDLLTIPRDQHRSIDPLLLQSSLADVFQSENPSSENDNNNNNIGGGGSNVSSDNENYAKLLLAIWSSIRHIKDANKVTPMSEFDESLLLAPFEIVSQSSNEKRKIKPKLLLKTIHALEKSSNVLVNKFNNRDPELLRAFEVLIENYKSYSTILEKIDKEDIQLYLQTPPVVGGFHITPRLLTSTIGEVLLSKDIKTSGLNDINDFSYGGIFNYDNITFKHHPRAPGAEFMLNSLAETITSTKGYSNELIKVIGQSGASHIYQANLSSPSRNLELLIKHHDSLIEKLDINNYGSYVILSLIANPEDCHPKNFYINLKFKDDQPNINAENVLQAVDAIDIVLINNDLAFIPPVILTHPNGSDFAQKPFSNIKNILYFLPQMKKPLSDRCRSIILDPGRLEQILIDWLAAIHEKNLHYQTLLQQNIFWDFVSNSQLQIPIKFSAGTISAMYSRLLRIRSVTLSSSNTSGWKLFKSLDSKVASYYSSVKRAAKRATNSTSAYLMACIVTLYEDSISSQAELQDFRNFVARSGGTDCFTTAALKLSEQQKFEDGRTQTTNDAMKELFGELQYDALEKSVFPSIQNLCSVVRQQSPLLYAAEFKLLPLMNWLLRNGLVNVNEKNKQGYTALHFAAGQNANEGMIKVLLEHKADPSLENNHGKTPADIARSRNISSALELLK